MAADPPSPGTAAPDVLILDPAAPAPARTAASGSPGDRGSPAGLRRTSLEDTRERIAWMVLATLAGVILLDALVSALLAQGCWTYGRCDRASAALGLLTTTLGTIFTAMIGLVGSVVGFYFGSRKAGGG